MLNRTFDADRINYLSNHPDIRPHIGGDGASLIDVTDLVADRDNIFLGGEHGAFCCTWTAPGVYEIHTLVLPEGRGAWAAQFARCGRDYMAANGARHLWTMVHPDARNVKAFTLRSGLKPAGIRKTGLGPYDLFDWRA